LLLVLFLLAAQSSDTVAIRAVPHPPQPNARIDSLVLGTPTLRIPTGQGTTLIWLLRASDTVFLAATIPDSSASWSDDFVVSLDTQGDAASSPQHDDFQWDLRRQLDSSVIYRGRNGRWEPPRNDPDWRLGPERSGGGWEVSGSNERLGWSVLLRLDPAWFAGDNGRRARLAFRIYNNAPSGWFAWPHSPRLPQASALEQNPSQWAPIR
jgi:hypothetical protein